jgi:hypothetical protein
VLEKEGEEVNVWARKVMCKRCRVLAAMRNYWEGMRRE